MVVNIIKITILKFKHMLSSEIIFIINSKIKNYKSLKGKILRIFKFQADFHINTSFLFAPFTLAQNSVSNLIAIKND